jgi:pimeloyl-ACP methyl ester carboxylesterase
MAPSSSTSKWSSPHMPERREIEPRLDERLSRHPVAPRVGAADRRRSDAKGAPAMAQTNYALGTENEYDYDFVPGTGHLLQIEQPADCARLVEEFVTKCGLRHP